MGRRVCLGLDLTSRAERPTAYAVLDGDRVADIGFVHSDDDILALADATRPAIVGLDAPLGLPRGLGCLEEPCACGRCQAGPARIRASELDLRRRLGIGCFYTTKRSIIKRMVYRGIALKGQFEAKGYAGWRCTPSPRGSGYGASHRNASKRALGESGPTSACGSPSGACPQSLWAMTRPTRCWPPTPAISTPWARQSCWATRARDRYACQPH